ncbi:MAG: pyridoxamine 5'-phosphate oxidase, partial [Mycobacteriaceae bacterium]|nr:pyridoxamine 5'-phosphate oxidase [Mycobacteriaceae bacterium]
LAGGWEPVLRAWISDAAGAGVAEPNAMVVATVDERGRPDARTVLCKGLSPAGVVFYTNSESAKAGQLAARRYAALTFTWPEIARQVRLRGPARQVPPEVTAEYWGVRPRGSQLGAWASNQSRPIGSRAELDRMLAEVESRFADTAEIPVPPHWSGYEVAPEEVEFWQGREGRLHHRLRLARTAADAWTCTLLQP